MVTSNSFLSFCPTFLLYVCVLSHVLLFVTPWTVAHQAPLSTVFQAVILQQVAISFSRRFSWPRDQTRVSCISCVGRWILYHCYLGSPFSAYLIFRFHFFLPAFLRPSTFLLSRFKTQMAQTELFRFYLTETNIGNDFINYWFFFKSLDRKHSLVMDCGSKLCRFSSSSSIY